MPLTAKGEKILAKMIEEYGEEKGKKVFYASKNAGTIEGVDTAEDAHRRRKRKGQSRDPFGREAGTWEEEEDDSVTVMNDSLTLEFDDGAAATIIEGGYMRAMPRIARTGIQIYHGKECGRDSMEKVRVYRSQDQVFAADAIKSYTHLPITLEHPGTAVTADNWKKFAVGETGEDVLRDGGTVRVPMMLRDAAAIKAVKDGKNQISVGYACDLEWVDGITEDGVKYDAIQRNIRGNHVAIVSTARGGPELKFGDHEREDAMDLKTIMIDGIACKVDDVGATLVQRMLDQFEAFKKKKKGEEEEEEKGKKDSAAKDAAIAVKDKEIADLQAKLKDALSPQRLDQAVKDRVAVIDKAAKIVGKQLKTDGMSDIDIKREIVVGKLGDAAKGWDDNKIEAGFDAITLTSASSTIADATRVFAGKPGAGYGHPSGSSDPRDQAYFDSVKELENAWRPKQ